MKTSFLKLPVSLMAVLAAMAFAGPLTHPHIAKADPPPQACDETGAGCTPGADTGSNPAEGGSAGKTGGGGSAGNGMGSGVIPPTSFEPALVARSYSLASWDDSSLRAFYWTEGHSDAWFMWLDAEQGLQELGYSVTCGIATVQTGSGTYVECQF